MFDSVGSNPRGAAAFGRPILHSDRLQLAERRRTPLILIQQAHRVIRIRGNALSAASDNQGGTIQPISRPGSGFALPSRGLAIQCSVDRRTVNAQQARHFRHRFALVDQLAGVGNLRRG
jgi:hypothetical protein